MESLVLRLKTFTYSVQETGPPINFVGGRPLLSVADVNSFSFIIVANRSPMNGVRMAIAHELGIICFDEEATSVFLLTVTYDDPPSVVAKH